MLTWKFLHITSMFAGVMLLVGGSVFFEAIARTRDSRTIARFGKVLSPLETAGVVSVVLGVIFGLVWAKVGHFGLGSPWLIFAYVMVGTLFILGPIESVMVGKIVQAAEAGDEAVMNAAIDDGKRKLLTAVSLVIYIVIIYDMVKKPF